MEFDELQARVMRRSDSPLFARLASMLLEHGDVNEAKDVCLNGINQYPRYASGYIVMAKCFAAESEFEEALRTLTQTRAIFPDSEILFVLKNEWETQLNNKPIQPAQSVQHQAEVPKAEQPAVEFQGEFVSPTLAEIYVKQGLIVEAIEAYEKLIEMKPEQRVEFEKRIGELEKKL
jgi:tetratricopeptide (TPR) repeat protein